jgi:hypothetical protein
MQARRLAKRAGEAFEAWQKYVEKMPVLKQKGIQFIFDEWGCRHRQVGGINPGNTGETATGTAGFGGTPLLNMTVALK